MSDQPTPDGQQTSLQQQERNWEASFKGLQPKYQAALQQITDLQNQLATKSSECEQLRLQLGSAGTERDRLNSDLGIQIQTLTTQLAEANSKLVPLQQMRAKIDAAKQYNYGDLLPIIDTIPYHENPDVLKATLETFDGFVAKKVKERESQLTTGVTPAFAVQNQLPTVPSDNEGWKKYVNEPGISQVEKYKRFDQWQQWGLQQGK